MKFKDFKAEILNRAKDMSACSDQYQRAKVSKNYGDIIRVITDNFTWCCERQIIDVELLQSVGAETCNKYNLFFNQNTETGYLLASGSATVRASGSATVRASDSATVEASGSATVRASGSATVRASDSATVEAWGSATVRAWGSATVRAWGSATVEASDSATVEAWGSATVRAWGSATVEASGSAYTISYNSIDHKISEKAICRYYYDNRIVLTGKGIKIEYQ